MTFTAAEAAKCPIEQFTKYALREDFPAKSQLQRALPTPGYQFTMNADTGLRTDIFFTVGPAANPVNEPVAEVQIIVCGRETVTTDGVYNVAIDKGGVAPPTLTAADYNTWFTIEAGPKGTTDECTGLTYELEKKAGFAFATVENDPLISFEGGNLVIVADAATLKASEYYLKATTVGGQTARKRISIFEPCVYSATENSGVAPVVLPYVAG